MKIRSLILSSLACAAFCACSSDDIVEAVDNGTQTPAICPTDEAYIAVNIVNSTSTKGTAGDSPYYYGTAKEHAVATADFYFYDAKGSYVGTGKAWDAGDAKDSGATTENIELGSNKFVVLKGLQNKEYPKYMVVVLNQITLLENKSLSDVKGILENAPLNGETFIMSNSTYNLGNAEKDYNFAVAVNDKNFLTETPKMEEMTAENVVTIHVERLAAKVQLSLAENLGNEISLGNYEIDGTEKELTLEILGWGLNGTNKNTRLMKEIDNDWDFGTFTWTGDNRTFWGKSTNYGDLTASYPAKAIEIKENDVLNYTSWDNLAVTMGQSAYCAENTNTEQVLKTGTFHSKLTEVLVKAQLKNYEGDLLRYENKLYTKDGYFNRVLAEVSPLAPKFWRAANAGEEGTTYVSLAKEDIEYVDAHDGRVTVQLTGTAQGYTWFKDNKGKTPATVEDIHTAITAVDPVAECYKDGMMYYNIPIEHLRGGTFSYNEANELQVNEADYGVVRNHFYQITINSIANLGTAVYNPAENIVPNDNDKTTYYIGSVIKILSWKIVNQNVSL